MQRQNKHACSTASLPPTSSMCLFQGWFAQFLLRIWLCNRLLIFLLWLHDLNIVGEGLLGACLPRWVMGQHDLHFDAKDTCMGGQIACGHWVLDTTQKRKGMHAQLHHTPLLPLHAPFLHSFTTPFILHACISRTLPEEHMGASLVNIIPCGVASVNHQAIHKLHRLGSLTPQLARDNDLTAFGSTLHDEPKDTVAGPTHR